MIDNTNRNFRGQLEDEVVLAFFRKHWILIVPQLFIIVVMPILLIALLISDFKTMVEGAISEGPYQAIMFALIIFLTFFIHRAFGMIYNYYLRVVIITNFRVIELDKTVVIHDKRDSIDLTKIQDIIMHQDGILKSLFNYGEIIITMSAVNSVKTLRYVPNPDYCFRKITKTKREYIEEKREAGGLQLPRNVSDAASVPSPNPSGNMSPPLTHQIGPDMTLPEYRS